MRYALLDTSVYIDHWERGLHASSLDHIRRWFLVRHSSVVMSELARGARTRDALRLVEGLEKLARPCWTPDERDWWTAGRILQRLSLGRGWEAKKLDRLQNDVLIALTARRFGATLVTRNRRDFEMLQDSVKISCLFL